MSTVSLLGAVVSIYFSTSDFPSRVPQFVRRVAFQNLAKMICMDTTASKEENRLQCQELPLCKNVEIVHQVEETRCNETVDVLLSIQNAMKSIEKKLSDKEKDSLIMLEWKLLSKVIDRILFFFCLIIFAIVSMSVYF